MTSRVLLPAARLRPALKRALLPTYPLSSTRGSTPPGRPKCGTASSACRGSTKARREARILAARGPAQRAEAQHLSMLLQGIQQVAGLIATGQCEYLVDREIDRMQPPAR